MPAHVLYVMAVVMLAAAASVAAAPAPVAAGMASSTVTSSATRETNDASALPTLHSQQQYMHPPAAAGAAEPTSFDGSVTAPPVDRSSATLPVRRGTAATTAASNCKSEYSVAGGSRPQYRGVYRRGPVSMSCHGQGVYIQATSKPNYLYVVPSATSGQPQWWVSDQANMNSCTARGVAYSAMNCSCPEACRAPATCSGGGCGVSAQFGVWLTNTGKTTPTMECPASVWCPSFFQVY